MFFWVKKLIGYCIMPVPLCLGLLVLGVVLAWRQRTARFGRLLLTATTLLFAVLANKGCSARLVRPLEVRYPPIGELTAGHLPARVAACRYVVVLGAGNGYTPGVAALDELSTSARARISEAARVLRVLPDARLLVSGPGEDDHETHATVLERAAVSLGIAAERIGRIEHARDTEDEAAAVKRRVGDQPVMLVTSAWHMPRAVALFASAGVSVVPCPTDYTSHDDGRFHWRDFLWDVESLERSSVGIRERVGYGWIWLRGKAGRRSIGRADAR